MTKKLTDEQKAENKAKLKANQKVKCPVCKEMVNVQKSSFPQGQCPNCEHPFRPYDFGIKPED